MFTGAQTSIQNETAEELYTQFMDPDKQTEKWLLVQSAGPTVTILALYLFIVLKLGPVFMKERGSYKLDLVLRLYNVAQVLYNGFVIYHFLKVTSGKTLVGFIFEQSCSLSEEYENIKDLKYMYIYTCWHFLVIKIIDLLDTVFMVLRKKMSQVTFLHVYHHAITVLATWYTFKYIKAPHGGFMLLINSFVHMVMYFYYLLATFDSLKKYLWWKKALTKLQLIQFVVVLCYLTVLYTNRCLMSRSFLYIWIFNVVVVMSLFINFYIKAYMNKTPSKVPGTSKQKVK